jgi:hypothetical protein
MALLLKRRGVCALTFSLVILITLITSYHCYLHDDVLLLLPIFLATSDGRQNRSPFVRAASIAVIAGLVLVPLLPSSLSATAFQTFALMAGWVLMIAWEMLSQDTLPSTPDAAAVAPGITE